MSPRAEEELVEVVRQGPDREAEKEDVEDASKVSLSYPLFVHPTVLI